MRKPIIKKGDKFNRLTAVKFDHRDKWRGQYWLFRCNCENEKVISSSRVITGRTKSCGCLQRETARDLGNKNKTHKSTGTKIYGIWQAMKARCNNQHTLAYKNYGGRGIKVCKRWEKFENFYKDMGEAPKGMSIDRIDNNGNYEPKNCRWATRVEQANNTRSNHLLTYKGKTQNIAQWAKEIGISYFTLKSRIILYKWSVEKALTTKVYEK